MFAVHGRLTHDLRNLVLGGLNTLVGMAFALSILTVTELAAAESFGLLQRVTWPTAVEWALAILLFDAWQYAWHRLNHRLPFLWRFHAVHHSDAELDASSALRFHAGEVALSSIARLAVLPLLGMTLPQVLLYEVILLPVILFHHANIHLPTRFDGLLRTVLVTPRMHWVHHSRKPIETDSNFASIFSFWDRLFRTFRLRSDPERIELGLDGWREDEQGTLRGLLAAPFRRRRQRSSS